MADAKQSSAETDTNCTGEYVLGDFLFVAGRFRIVGPVVWSGLTKAPAVRLVEAKRFHFIQLISKFQPIYP